MQSLVRFVKIVGSMSLQEVHGNVIEYIHKLIYPTKKTSAIKHKGHPLLETLLQKDIECKRDTMTNIDIKNFDLIAEAIDSAKRTFCVG
jgi:DNA-binding MurR/RpiR family transcriptional regulator